MKIGIIGSGNIGSALAHRFTAAGHTVAIANSRGPESLTQLATDTGATAVSVVEATRDKDIVVVTIPEKNIPQLPKGLFDNLKQTIVIDSGNYYPQQRDGRIDAIENGTPESSWVAQQLGTPVIKAFNNIYAQHLLENGRPSGAPGRIALPIAGDDTAALAVVSKVIDEIGFDSVETTSLAESWRQQPGTPVYGADLDTVGTRRALAEASETRTPEWRAA